MCLCTQVMYVLVRRITKAYMERATDAIRSRAPTTDPPILKEISQSALLISLLEFTI